MSADSNGYLCSSRQYQHQAVYGSRWVYFSGKAVQGSKFERGFSTLTRCNLHCNHQKCDAEPKSARVRSVNFVIPGLYGQDIVATKQRFIGSRIFLVWYLPPLHQLHHTNSTFGFNITLYAPEEYLNPEFLDLKCDNRDTHVAAGFFWAMVAVIVVSLVILVIQLQLMRYVRHLAPREQLAEIADASRSMIQGHRKTLSSVQRSSQLQSYLALVMAVVIFNCVAVTLRPQATDWNAMSTWQVVVLWCGCGVISLRCGIISL